MADTSNLSSYLKDLADAIRTKKETTEQIPAANFDTEILSIETGIDTSDANATANDIVQDKTAYVNGEKITGTIQLAPYQTEDELRELGIDPTLFDKDGYKAIVVGGADGTTVVGLHIPFVSYAYLKGGYIISALANAELAEDINLSADKIVQGNTILGIEGTAEVGPITQIEYDECLELSQQILGENVSL